eukprot:scaffold165812_cov31-Tisochrysis_lutea.AAC.1
MHFPVSSLSDTERRTERPCGNGRSTSSSSPPLLALCCSKRVWCVETAQRRPRKIRTGDTFPAATDTSRAIPHANIRALPASSSWTREPIRRPSWGTDSKHTPGTVATGHRVRAAPCEHRNPEST